ncbi:hypothetical protein ACFL52_00330 [Candidatus Margulisiibacteriota bacterium]
MIIKYKNAIKIHIDKILKAVDTKKIRKQKFKVVIDACNGAGGKIGPQLLKKLGCYVIAINTKQQTPFPHSPEPTPQNLKALCKKVKASKADIGFAQDPDADRLSIVTNKGIAISEEYTLALAALAVFIKEKKKKKAIVANLSTSSLINYIAKIFKAKEFRTRIGEVYVATRMKKVGAAIGGEGNGGVIFPKVCYNRDSLSGMGLILQLLAETGQTIGQIVAGLPVYYLAKEKIACKTLAEAEKILKKAEKIYKHKKMDRTEGLKVFIKDAWIHIRASNTEPVVRIFCESSDKRTAVDAIHELRLRLQV